MAAFGFCLSPHSASPLPGRASCRPTLNVHCSDNVCSTADIETELSFLSVRPSSNASSHATANMSTAKQAIRTLFHDLEQQSIEESYQYTKAGLEIPQQKAARWAAYTNKEHLRAFMAEAMEFMLSNAEFRTRPMEASEIRFLSSLQHFISEDVNDIYSPVGFRKNNDSFEGFLTESVNSQLLKDAHRSEWSVDGVAHSIHKELEKCQPDDRRKLIQTFQKDLVTALEEYLLAFCKRRRMSAIGTKRLIQAVTTQMSQCGLANFDRGSSGSRYFINGQGLEQRTSFSLSSMTDLKGEESLQLSMLCMKTGFKQYHTEDSLGVNQIGFSSTKVEGPSGPYKCSPSSYLYLYATVKFMLGPLVGPCERISVQVLDALDEARIIAAP